MDFYDDSEVINPIIKLIKEYEQFEKEEMIKYNLEKKSRKKNQNYKLFKIIGIYIIIFISISMFKMSVVYEIVNLNIELQTLNSEIFESKKIIDNLNNNKIIQIDLNKVEKESKKLGFTDQKKITYVYFK